MLGIMASRLKLNKLPEREELWKTMPSCFLATYGSKIVAIVDANLKPQ